MMGSEVLVTFYQCVKRCHVASPLQIHFMNGGYFARLYRHTRFWGVFDHLNGKQRVANGILGCSRGFACKGEHGSWFDLTQNGKTACSKLLLHDLDGLLPGCMGRERCSRNVLPVCS